MRKVGQKARGGGLETAVAGVEEDNQ